MSEFVAHADSPVLTWKAAPGEIWHRYQGDRAWMNRHVQRLIIEKLSYIWDWTIGLPSLRHLVPSHLWTYR